MLSLMTTDSTPPHDTKSGCGCLPIGVFLFVAIVTFLNHGGLDAPPQRRSALPQSQPPFEMSWRPGMAVFAPDRHGNPPLHQAVLAGDLKAFAEIYDGKPDLTALDRHGRTALMAALEERQIEMASRILGEPETAKPLVNHLNRARRTPLMAALESGNATVSFQLLDLGADLKAVTPTGRTMLHCAAIGGNPTLVEHLLKNGFEVNVEHDGRWTPLHYAAQEGHAEAVSYLLARGADFRARLRHGWTPADLARSRGHLEIVKLLEQRVER